MVVSHVFAGNWTQHFGRTVSALNLWAVSPAPLTESERRVCQRWWGGENCTGEDVIPRAGSLGGFEEEVAWKSSYQILFPSFFSVCMCCFVHTCICACVGECDISRYPPFLPRWGLLLSPELTDLARLAGQQAPKIFWFPCPLLWDFRLGFLFMWVQEIKLKSFWLCGRNFTDLAISYRLHETVVSTNVFILWFETMSVTPLWPGALLLFGFLNQGLTI